MDGYAGTVIAYILNRSGIIVVIHRKSNIPGTAYRSPDSHHNVREQLKTGSFIDVTHVGSLKGMIKGVDKLLLLAVNRTKIIAGHGPLGDKRQLTSYREMLWTAYERLRKLKAEGKTAQEAAAAKPLDDLDAIWGKGLFKSDQWIELFYSGV